MIITCSSFIFKSKCKLPSYSWTQHPSDPKRKVYLNNHVKGSKNEFAWQSCDRFFTQINHSPIVIMLRPLTVA